jgi:predicted dehydrogenase
VHQRVCQQRLLQYESEPAAMKRDLSVNSKPEGQIFNCGSSALVTRRSFLSALGAAAAAPLIVPATVVGGKGAVVPSERITIGMIGTGNQGTAHTRVLVRIAQAQIVAVCDPVREKRQKARQLVENFAEGNKRGCADYSDFRELLARPDIDAVFIASPEHWHALHTVAAARSGKDIYCEKAMAKTIAESQAMVKAVRQHQRVFQLGTQQRSFGNFRLACELARNEYLGQLHTIKVGDPKGYPGPKVRSEAVPEGLDYEMWLGPAPSKPYFPERLENLKGWMLCYDYTVGFLSGWGQHDIDIAQWGNGTDHTTPIAVEGHATFPAEGLNDAAATWHLEHTYANGVRLIFTSDNENPYGIRFEGKEGWVFVNREKIEAQPESLLKIDFKSNDTRLYRSDNHHLDFLRSVRTRLDPICPVETGHHTYVICNLSDIAARLKRKLRWDPRKETFPEDEEANRMLNRPMRAPWKL